MVNRNEKQDVDMKSFTKNEMIYEFSNGVPGFPEFKTFYIKSLREGFYDPLKLMVSTENPAVSFILYPHVNGDSLFNKKALEEFAKTYDDKGDEVDIYSVVTVREPNGHLHLTTNLKAPIVLNKKEQKGWQHIIPSKETDLTFHLDQLSNNLQKIRAKSA